MVRRAVFVLLALVWLGRAAVAALVTPWETTGHFTTMDQLAGFLHGLVSNGSWKVSVQQAGQSSIQHKPIWAVRLTPPSPELKVMILARVHGNEPAATEAALTMIRDVLSDSGDKAPMYRECEFLIVPCLNPEGAERAQAEADANDGWWGALGRENDEDLDINRDYLRLTTSEARTAVSLYDSFQPSLVLDLHEFESRPLVAGDGWWRAEYWDLLIGAGRAPWASPSLRTYCRSVAQDVLFPKLDAQGVRSEFYMLPSGSFDSSMHFASNAADYFLVRGTPAFLLESAGGDEGESSANRRVNAHRVAIDALLEEVTSHAARLKDAMAAAAAEHERTVALEVVPHKRAVKLMGTDGMGFGFESTIDVGGKTYHAHQVARFEGLDYDVKTSAPLPAAFLVETKDAGYLRVLSLHGLSMVTSTKQFTVGATVYPAGTVVVSATKPLAGLLLLREIQDLTPNHLPARGLVTEAPASFQMPEGKPLVTVQDCLNAAHRMQTSGE